MTTPDAGAPLTREQTVRLLAVLVHRGALTPADAREALAQRDPIHHLIAAGRMTPEQWREWVATEGGARPVLTRYELGDVLGEGGQARVFHAVDRNDGAVVALKVLRPEIAKDPVAVKRFVDESKLLMQLDHPNIVRGRRVARERDTFFCAMEEIRGECLQATLDRDGGIDEETALRVVRQVADALEHLHRNGLVHRDVKPGNIMLDEDGRAVLIDLGFAVGGRDAAGGDTTAGTVHYISPEQARGAGGLDVRADIYSLGATLYHLVTGSLPFAGRTSEEVLAKQVLESLSGERIRTMNLSQQVYYLIEKMMAKDKENRFQDPRQLVQEIDAVLAAREREEAGRGAGAAKKVRRRRRRWL